MKKDDSDVWGRPMEEIKPSGREEGKIRPNRQGPGRGGAFSLVPLSRMETRGEGEIMKKYAVQGGGRRPCRLKSRG